MRLRVLLVSILILVLSTPAYADQAKAAYKRGVRAEAHRQYDAAYEAYKQAYTLKPNEPKYLAAYARLRVQASAEHVRAGQSLRDSLKLQESLAEFQRAAEIDSSNFVAQQELRRITDMLRKQAQQPGVAIATKPESPLAKKAGAIEGPVDLEFPSDTPLTLRMTNTADVVYKTIGKLAGINVLFEDRKSTRLNSSHRL